MPMCPFLMNGEYTIAARTKRIVTNSMTYNSSQMHAFRCAQGKDTAPIVLKIPSAVSNGKRQRGLL